MRAILNTSPGEYMISDSEVMNILPPGIYTYDTVRNGVSFTIKPLQDGKIVLDNDQISIYSTIQKFWDANQMYKDMGLTHKRGYLLYGPPGTGKTTLIRYAVQEHIKNGGYVLDTFNYMFKYALRSLKAQPDCRILVILEDLEEYDDSDLTEAMDGLAASDNLLFIGTTNNIEELSSRLKNRPSRFDEKILIGYPSSSIRKNYIVNILQNAPEADIDFLVEISENLSIAHIKELIIKKVVYQNTKEELIKLSKTFEEQCIAAN